MQRMQTPQQRDGMIGAMHRVNHQVAQQETQNKAEPERQLPRCANFIGLDKEQGGGRDSVEQPEPDIADPSPQCWEAASSARPE